MKHESKVPSLHPRMLGREGQLHSGKRMWVGMKGEMVHEKVLHSLAPPCLLFVLAGFHTGATLLWVISIAKKRSKPRDNLRE